MNIFVYKHYFNAYIKLKKRILSIDIQILDLDIFASDSKHYETTFGIHMGCRQTGFLCDLWEILHFELLNIRTTEDYWGLRYQTITLPGDSCPFSDKEKCSPNLHKNERGSGSGCAMRLWVYSYIISYPWNPKMTFLNISNGLSNLNYLYEFSFC